MQPVAVRILNSFYDIRLCSFSSFRPIPLLLNSYLLLRYSLMHRPHHCYDATEVTPEEPIPGLQFRPCTQLESAATLS
jgi:hypothetical protein